MDLSPMGYGGGFFSYPVYPPPPFQTPPPPPQFSLQPPFFHPPIHQFDSFPPLDPPPLRPPNPPPPFFQIQSPTHQIQPFTPPDLFPQPNLGSELQSSLGDALEAALSKLLDKMDKAVDRVFDKLEERVRRQQDAQRAAAAANADAIGAVPASSKRWSDEDYDENSEDEEAAPENGKVEEVKTEKLVARAQAELPSGVNSVSSHLEARSEKLQSKSSPTGFSNMVSSEQISIDRTRSDGMHTLLNSTPVSENSVHIRSVPILNFKSVDVGLFDPSVGSFRGTSMQMLSPNFLEGGIDVGASRKPVLDGGTANPLFNLEGGGIREKLENVKENNADDVEFHGSCAKQAGRVLSLYVKRKGICLKSLSVKRRGICFKKKGRPKLGYDKENKSLKGSIATGGARSSSIGLADKDKGLKSGGIDMSIRDKGGGLATNSKIMDTNVNLDFSDVGIDPVNFDVLWERWELLVISVSDNSTEECSRRYELLARFVDTTEELYLSVFNNEAEKIKGSSAVELNESRSEVKLPLVFMKGRHMRNPGNSIVQLWAIVLKLGIFLINCLTHGQLHKTKWKFLCEHEIGLFKCVLRGIDNNWQKWPVGLHAGPELGHDMVKICELTVNAIIQLHLNKATEFYKDSNQWILGRILESLHGPSHEPLGVSQAYSKQIIKVLLSMKDGPNVAEKGFTALCILAQDFKTCTDYILKAYDSKMWDWNNISLGICLVAFSEHEVTITAFDKNRLLTSSLDETVCAEIVVWDISGDCLKTDGRTVADSSSVKFFTALCYAADENYMLAGRNISTLLQFGHETLSKPIMVEAYGAPDICPSYIFVVLLTERHRLSSNERDKLNELQGLLSSCQIIQVNRTAHIGHELYPDSSMPGQTRVWTVYS